MRVIEQLIDHLSGSGYLTGDQLEQLRGMGLLRDPSRDPSRRYEDYCGDENYWSGDDDVEFTDADGWDEHTDRLLAEDRRVAAGRRRDGNSRGRGSNLLGVVERSIAGDREFLDLVVEVARRLDPQADVDVAARRVGSAEPGRLDAVLARDSLWARLWPHVAHEPIVSALDDRIRRRFCDVLAARGRPNKSLPRHLVGHKVVRRAADVIAAHRALSRAFGRVALGLDRRRAFVELDLCSNPTGYEVLVILFSAHTARHTVADLPGLAASGALPALAWLESPHFVSGWATAARIDPVAVLPFMTWCMSAWASAPAAHAATCRLLQLDGVGYIGRTVPQSPREWFSVGDRDAKWVTLWCTTNDHPQPGEPTRSLSFDGVEYVQIRPVRERPMSRRFFRVDAPGVMVVSWSTETVSIPDFGRCRGDYGGMWAAGLFALPVLTCPRQWGAEMMEGTPWR
jgi:hypothetical protein